MVSSSVQIRCRTNSSTTSRPAPYLASWSASKFHSLGIRQNVTCTPPARHLSNSSFSTTHKSRFKTAYPGLVTHPLCSPWWIHCVIPRATYSESHAMTTLSQPSLSQLEHCNAAITARSSARQVVCGCKTWLGPRLSRRKHTPPFLMETPSGYAKGR